MVVCKIGLNIHMALRYGFGRGGVVNKGALTGKRWDGGEVVWGKRVIG